MTVTHKATLMTGFCFQVNYIVQKKVYKDYITVKNFTSMKPNYIVDGKFGYFHRSLHRTTQKKNKNKIISIILSR